MRIIRISTENELTVHDFPKGNYAKQHEVLKKLIGSRCDTIEHVLPKRLYAEFGVPNSIMKEKGGFVSMLIDEEGIFHGLGQNIVGSYLYETDKHGWPILGNVLFVGERWGRDGIDFCGISDKRFGLLYPQLKEITEKARNAG